MVCKRGCRPSTVAAQLMCSRLHSHRRVHSHRALIPVVSQFTLWRRVWVMHRDDDDMELAVRPMLGRIMRSMGGLAYTVYTTPLYLIRSTTALGLDVLLRLTSGRETPAALIEKVPAPTFGPVSHTSQ